MYPEFGTSEENVSTVKSPVKWLEVPIQKFNTAVPHFVELLKDYHNNIVKLKRLNQWDDVQKQFIGASKTANQLNSLVNEMDNLRDQVADTEVAKFDKLISDSKQSALTAIQNHKGLSIKNEPLQNIDSEGTSVDNVEDSKVDHQLQLVAELEEDIKEQEQGAASMERLQEDVEDIHTLYQDFAQLVHKQGESVEQIEDSVEAAHSNVVEGERMLCQAAKYKSGMYPLVGALLGSVLGGPIGLVAGFKLGGLTAFACGLLGFTGGKILKNQNEVTINEANQYRQELADQ